MPEAKGQQSLPDNKQQRKSHSPVQKAVDGPDHAVEMGSWAVPGLWSAVVLEVIWTWGEEGGRAEGRL